MRSAQHTTSVKLLGGALPAAAVLFLLLVLSARLSHSESWRDKADVAAGHYQNQRYEEAARILSEAAAEAPGNAELAYNLANSQYKAGRYQEAAGAYARLGTSATDPGLRQHALYNAGNALYQLNKLEEAVASYEKALQLDPKDADAKYNLDLVKERLKKRAPPPPAHDENAAAKNKDQRKSDKDAAAENPASPPDEQNDNKPPIDDRQAPPPEKDADNRPGASLPAASNGKHGDKNHPADGVPADMQPNMSKKEAEQWLNTLDENPKKFRQQALRKAHPVPRDQGKDW